MLDWGILLLPVAIGYPAAAALVRPGNLNERIPYAWFIGTSIATFPFLVGGYLGVHQNWLLLLGSLVISVALGFLRTDEAECNRQIIHGETTGAKVAAVLLILTALALLALSGVVAVQTPIVSTDVKAFWLPKAVLLADPANVRQLGSTVYPDYPPAWPLHLGIAGKYLHNLALQKALPSLYTFFAVWSAFCFVRLRVGLVAGAFTALFFSANPYLISTWTGLWDILADVPTMAFTVVSSLALLRYLESASRKAALLVGMFGAATILLRPEGFIHAGLLTVLGAGVALRGRRLAHATLIVAAPMLVYLTWHAIVRWGFGRTATYATTQAHLGDVLTLRSMAGVLHYCVVQLVSPEKLGPVVFLVASSFVARTRASLVLALVFFTEIAVLCGLYCVLPATNQMPQQWWLETGFKRMLLHLVPLAAIAAGLGSGGLFDWIGRRPPAASPAGDWTGSTLRFALAGIFSALAMMAAASRPLELVDVQADAASGLHSPLSYGDERGWWQGGMPRNSIMMAPAKNSTASISYNLYNLGAKNSPEWIAGAYARFETYVAVIKTDGGEVRFSAFADGMKLFESQKLTGRSSRQHISVLLPGWATRLELRVDSLADNNSDHAVWIEPQLIPSRLPLASVVTTLGASLLALGASLWSRRRPGCGQCLPLSRAGILLGVASMATTACMLAVDASRRLLEYCLH